MNNLATICILAYKRPQDLKTTIETLHKYLDYPSEIILNLDGSPDETLGDLEAKELALQYLEEKKISKLILNNGKNRGVGRSFQNCIGLSEGEFIFKVDSDIIFTQKTISRAVQCLKDYPDIGCLGLFDYNKWDKNDERFKPENNVIEKRGDVLIVKDLVSSIFAFRKQDLLKQGNIDLQDDGIHQSFGKMAIIDAVDNVAFGVSKSVYLSGTEDNPRKTDTFQEPLIFTTV